MDALARAIGDALSVGKGNDIPTMEGIGETNST